MKNLILVSILLFFFSCEKFEKEDFYLEYPAFSNEKWNAEKIEKLKKRNQFLLDSLLSEICYFGHKVDITCQKENAFKTAIINNKEQKQTLLKWQSCFDSLKLNFDISDDFLYYFDIGYKAKPITAKELQKRIKTIEKGQRKKFDLRIYFNKDTMIDCFGAYFGNLNLIVIYNYLDTSLYGNNNEYLARGLLFFHEIFHADTISMNSFSVGEQHIVINYYENDLVNICLNIDDYAENFLENFPSKKHFKDKGNIIFPNINNIIYAKKELEKEKARLALNKAMNSLNDMSKALSKK